MGRRALTKLNPDVERHYRELDDLSLPLEVQSFFANPAPLEVEMGSGKGLFLATASEAQPEHNFLGIELARKYARHAAGRLTQNELTNAVMLQGDGLKLFREFLAAESVHAVHVYFPDPWWKTRHRKRRVMNEPFLKDIERVLIPGGRLHFWTDVHAYFEATLKLIASVSPLEGPFDVPVTDAQHDLDYRTHFERRMRMHGEPVYRSEYVKKK